LLKYLLFGGEIANVNCVRLLLQQGKPQHLIHVYGPTENTTFSTWYEIDNIAENAQTIPIGQAVANSQVYLLDADLNPVPAHAVSEIYLGGDGLAAGYLNRPELTAERFIQVQWPCLDASGDTLDQPLRLYKTGDRALYRPDGHLEFLGRTDGQIKLRGFRVELSEIEAVLAQHSAVQTAAVIVREAAHQEANLQDNRQLVAYVVPSSAEFPTERELRSFLKTKLPDYMLPTAWVMLDQLPLTVNGKVDVQALPQPHFSWATGPISTTAPTTSIETVLVELWSQLLGRKSIGIHDHFFELGGHSLLATQMVSRIRDRLQVELPLRTVFETPTLAALAQQIETLKPGISGAVHSGSATIREEIEL
jgi:acyl-CoA synthetase (AMP-forming)/AMP-acid ligase II/acyl carrier protein